MTPLTIFNPILGTTTVQTSLVAQANLDDFGHTEWVQRYGMRRLAYLMAPYGAGEVAYYGLFTARDPYNNVIAFTRRVNADFRFIVEKDVAAVVGPLSLEVVPAVKLVSEEAAVILQAEGEAIWQRSGLDGWWERAVRDAAICGSMFMEAVRDGESTRVVSYPPENCEAVYDDYGTRLVRLWVRMTVYEGSESPDAVNVRDNIGKTIARRIDSERVDVWIDGVKQPDGVNGAGPHFFGVCPAVHVPWVPYSQPEHGLGSGEGIDAALAMADSLASQMAAIGNRHANPILLGKGVGLQGIDLFKLGRSIQFDGDGEVSYLEANLQGVTALLDQANTVMANVRATNPQFALYSAGANASGEALRTLGAGYVSYIEAIRRRVHGALALVTAYARSMAAGETWRADRAVYRVAAPPVLPADVATETERAKMLVAEGLMTRADAIRHLQRLGVVDPEQSPVEYAARIATEQAELDAAAMDRMAALRVSGAVIADETDPERVAQDLDAIAQAIAEGDTAAALEELAALREVMGRGRG
jgi:hypothetical protein